MPDIQVETPPAPLADATSSVTTTGGTAASSAVTSDQTSPQEAAAPPAPPPKAVPAAPASEETPAPKAVPAADAESGKAEEKHAPDSDPGKENTEFSVSSMKESLQNSIIAGNIPQIVLHMITYATNMGVSDIHIEPQEKMVRIRFRTDGVLQLVVEYPSNIHPAVVSRVKIMSGLKIDEQRVPQDGRMQITTEDGKSLDLRVSTLPTVNGEKIVSRIQDKSKTIPDLPDLGVQGGKHEKNGTVY